MVPAMSNRSDIFVKSWVSANVHNVPGVKYAAPRVAELTAKLVGDASMAGITHDELMDTVGNLSDFLTNEFEQVQYRELGSKD
jgi:hypothetical protein